jgi:hypothetical protein
MQKIGQETLVPLGVAVVVIGAIATWVNTVESKIAANTAIIKEIRTTNDASLKQVYEINSRLSKIEWAIEKKK